MILTIYLGLFGFLAPKDFKVILFWAYLKKLIPEKHYVTQLDIFVFAITNCYFSYVVAVGFISGGNRSTQRRPSTCRKSLTNFIAWYCIEYISPWTGFECKDLCWEAMIAQIVVNPTTIRSRPRWPFNHGEITLLFSSQSVNYCGIVRKMLHELALFILHSSRFKWQEMQIYLVAFCSCELISYTVYE